MVALSEDYVLPLLILLRSLLIHLDFATSQNVELAQDYPERSLNRNPHKPL